MKLIVGLGNPGKEYETTRHNIGFMILDEYIQNDLWKNKFDGFYQIITIREEKVLFLKPNTYMNLSGNAVRKVVDFYHIKMEDILIIHDDLDLPFQTHRIKKNSSSGGHNGIKSIISCLGNNSFCRLKIGIASSNRGNTIDYVLSKFSKQEMEFLKKQYSVYHDIINSFIQNGVEKTMCNFN